MMKNNVEIKRNKEEIIKYAVIAAFAVLVFVIHCFIAPDFGDDLAYQELWNERPLGELLKDRYQNWSSRVIIEAVMMPLIAASPWIWRIFNVFMILLFVWNVSDLFGDKDKKFSFILFGMFIWLIPMQSLCSAGWITTTTNYLWSLSLGTVALRPVAYAFTDRAYKKWEYICYPLCAVYAANMEQMAAIMLGIYLVFGIYLLVQKKKISPLYFVQLLLILLSLCFIFASPGIDYRSNRETEKYFPEFAEMSIGGKALMGFIESFHYYLAGGHGKVSCLVAGLTGILLIIFLSNAGKQKKQKWLWLKGTVIALPFLSYWSFSHLFHYLLYDINIGKCRRILAVISENRQVPGQSSHAAIFILIQVFAYCIVLLCIALSLFFIHGKTKETFIQLILLAAGFASRVIIGFSPTIYASGDRTALFCSAAILIVTYRNLILWLKTKPDYLYGVLYGVYIAMLIGGNVMNLYQGLY